MTAEAIGRGGPGVDLHPVPARARREGDRLPGGSGRPASTSWSSRATPSTSSSAQLINVLQETADSAAERRRERAAALRGRSPASRTARTVKAILQDKRVLYVSATRAIAARARRHRRRRRRRRADEQPAAGGHRQRDHRVRGHRPGRGGHQVRAERLQRDRSAHRDRPPRSTTTRSRRRSASPSTSWSSEFGLRIPDIVEQLNEEAAP